MPTTDSFSHLIKPLTSDLARCTLIPSHGTRLPMTHIRNLPDEVLFKIFRKGCEELNLENGNLLMPKQYPIICVARTVCRRWWQLIGYYDHSVYKKRYFWYTYSYLFLNGWQTLSGLATMVSKFKWSLDSSQESDIWLGFYLPENWGKDVMHFSEHDAALLSLFIRCIGFITPHQEQIIHYEIHANQPQFLSHLLELLMSQMKCVSWHPTIDFKYPLPSLSNVLWATSIIPLSLLSRPISSKSLSFPTAHTEKFDLTRHHLSWLDGALMKFPFTITNLIIPPVSLLKAGSFLNAIGNHLISLTIVTMSLTLGEELESLEEYFALPRLLYLEIKHTSNLWAEYFLKHMVFPCLESAKLADLRESFPSPNLNSRLSLHSFDQWVGHPNLQRLHVNRVSPSQSSIFCITYFMQHTICDLELELIDLWDESTLVSLLNSIHPERLKVGKIRLINWKIALIILTSLNLTLLRELEIISDLSEEPKHYLAASVECSLFLDKLESSMTILDSFWIKSCFLKSISFRGYAPEDLFFLEIILGCIDTRSPITLQVDFNSFDGIGSSNDVFGLHDHVDRLSPIISLNIILSGDGMNDHHLLINLLSFTPRLQQLALEVTDWVNIPDIKNLFRSLATHDSQGQLIPYLSSFTAQIRVGFEKQENFLKQIRAIIFDCLRKRHHHGATSLRLCDLSFVQCTGYRDKLRMSLKHVPEKQSSAQGF